MILRAVIVALVAALVLVGAQTWRLHRAELTVATLRADAATAEAKAQAAAREQERKHVEEIASIEAGYQQNLEMVAHKSRVVIDDLRAGNLRLREQWQGCQADRVPDSPAAAASVDAAEQGRAASAARIVRAADTCDAQVAALQALVRADREGSRQR